MRELLGLRRRDKVAPVSRFGASRSVVPVSRMSTVDLIVAELRKAILAGDLAVGEPLREVEIASQLGVSRGPLREAAQRIVQEGLLVSIPGRGLRVRRIPAEEVPDLYESRLAIEAHAARRLAQRPNAVETAELEACLARLVAVSAGDEAVPIGDADIAFHRQLVDLVGSARMSKRIDTLLAETRIANLSTQDGYAMPREVSHTYRELIDAIVAGHGEVAADALSRQFEAAIARLTGVDDSTETIESPIGTETASFARIEPVE
ncbi:transcriptional regulator [Microbacterium sorbitolivorans]|uniref:GntR family transcriptional regulator n=1 Tax=Microbacterium sorbitolivorans TaxID=1867410 RepID=A0A367XY17_9MICO|nr:GntR family transcriptional regulator [Microbacterium sorbitolivorans]RCK58535.1 GntR family transcriptional regulator [Microbacterium sorbitolivorans]GGF37338.1 transcriptional regulator [Microbacterium sorbitolivorans]